MVSSVNIKDGNFNGSVAYDLESNPTCDTCGVHDTKVDTTKQTHDWREEKWQNNNIELDI